MRIIGCDLHARQQTVAMLDTETGEVVNRTLLQEGGEVREFYSSLPRPVLVGIEAIGPMQWFLDLLEELGIECQVGDATKIRAAEPRKQARRRKAAPCRCNTARCPCRRCCERAVCSRQAPLSPPRRLQDCRRRPLGSQ